MASLAAHILRNNIQYVQSHETTYVNLPIKLVGSQHSPISFGKYCAIGPNLKIITLGHDYNYPAVQGKFYREKLYSMHPGESNLVPTPERTHGPVNIGSDVWIGEDVTILSGVTIGDGCCIGTKSVVTKDMEPYSICAGIPCKKIKNRYDPEKIEYLLRIKWWDWSDLLITRNYKFFKTNLNKASLEEIQELVELHSPRK